MVQRSETVRRRRLLRAGVANMTRKSQRPPINPLAKLRLGYLAYFHARSSSFDTLDGDKIESSSLI
jgi:hypothetical protein